MQKLTEQLVADYNLGNPMSYLAKKYKLQPSSVKLLLLDSGSTLRRPEYLTELELIALAKTMTLDEVAEYLYVQPVTLKRHLRNRNIEFPKFKSKDELYIEKQTRYLYLKENMSAIKIARSLNVETNRVINIINDIKNNSDDESNRCYIASLSSLGEAGGHFIEYHDLANVFPKQRQYARAY